MNKTTVAQQAKTANFLPPASGILQRQCACGNHTVAGAECAECAKKKNNLQAKLAIGSSNDPLELEADRIADRVLASPQNPSASDSALTIQRYTGPLTGNAETAPNSVENVLVHPGRPLEPALRQDMEQRFGHDFSQVRMHSGAAAEQSAREINANAYTVGRDIVFGAGQFAPESHRGRRLIAHELTHVLQQNGPFIATEPSVQKQAAAPAPAPAPAAATGGLSEEMLKQIARTLRAAMAGWGTDEEAIYSAFSGRTQEQVDAIARVYQAMYSADLLADLRDELSDSEMARLAIFSPTAAPGEAGSAQQSTAFAEMAAHQLNKAMAGLGTDEESIYSALTGRTQAELQAIKDAYKRLTNRDLKAAISDEMSGAELTRALALLNQGVLLPEDEAYFAMKGAGTDEETLLRVLESVKGDRTKITDLIDKFAAKGYGNLLERVNEELSGTDLNKAMEALHGETPSGNCRTEERRIGLEAISGAVALAQNAASELNSVIGAGKLSKKVESALKDNFNPGGATGAVTLGLAGQVQPVLQNTRSDLLSVSDITCGSPAPCVANPSCSSFTAGWTYAVAGATVRLCPAFFTCLSSGESRIMLHEFVHHIGIDDKAYHHEASFSSLTPLGDKSAGDSLDNADSYAHFADDLS